MNEELEEKLKRIAEELFWVITCDNCPLEVECKKNNVECVKNLFEWLKEL